MYKKILLACDLDRPPGRDMNFQLEVPDVIAVHLSLQALCVPPVRGMRDTWCSVFSLQHEGQREFLAQNPDGYLIRSSQHLGARREA